MADIFSGTTAQVSPFYFGTHAVRIIVRDGEPWFVAKDVMAALDYSGHSAPAKVCEHIPVEWKGVNPIHTPGGEQKMLCLSEPGLYFFLGRSDKPAALPFQKWVYGEVLPSIRKTGRYEKPGREMTVTEMVEKMTRQVSEPNGHPALLFMPLVEAVQRKLGHRQPQDLFAIPATTKVEQERFRRAAVVAREIAKQVYAYGDFNPYSRWAFTFVSDPRTCMPTIPHAWLLPDDAMYVRLSEFARRMDEGEMRPTNQDLANIAASCQRRLTRRMEYDAAEGIATSLERLPIGI